MKTFVVRLPILYCINQSSEFLFHICSFYQFSFSKELWLIHHEAFPPVEPRHPPTRAYLSTQKLPESFSEPWTSEPRALLFPHASIHSCLHRKPLAIFQPPSGTPWRSFLVSFRECWLSFLPVPPCGVYQHCHLSQSLWVTIHHKTRGLLPAAEPFIFVSLRHGKY